MKKLLKLVIAVCAFSSVFAFAFCADCEPYGNGFVKVFGTTIRGRPAWAKHSEVFKEGRTITIPTLIVCDHEVTKAEYKAVMKMVPRNQAKTSGKAKNNPVNNVSWYDAIEYCNKLSIKEGFTPCYKILNDRIELDYYANGYRLPTEAEWEYLACGKDGYKYSGSDNIDLVAWYGDNSKKGTHEVKTKKSNAFGLYDMSGNVWEWCWDAWGIIDETTSIFGPTSGDLRVMRGCSWLSNVKFLNLGSVFYRRHSAIASSVSSVGDSEPKSRNADLGFRVVRTAE